MNMDEITKVTIWNVTASVDKDTGKVITGTANKWCIAVFTKADGAMPLAKFMLGLEGKDVKKYLGVYKHSEAVVLASEFATEYKLKAAEKTVVAEYAACEPIVKAEREAKAAAKAERKAHPELCAARKFNKAVEGLQKVAVKSANVGFKRAVVDISKRSMSMLEMLEAEVKEAEAEKDEKQEELKAIAAAA